MREPSRGRESDFRDCWRGVGGQSQRDRWRESKTEREYERKREERTHTRYIGRQPERAKVRWKQEIEWSGEDPQPGLHIPPSLGTWASREVPAQSWELKMGPLDPFEDSPCHYSDSVPGPQCPGFRISPASHLHSLLISK